MCVGGGEDPRGTSTSATAKPSGTLCTAKLAEMNAPSWDPPWVWVLSKGLEGEGGHELPNSLG